MTFELGLKRWVGFSLSNRRRKTFQIRKITRKSMEGGKHGPYLGENNERGWIKHRMEGRDGKEIISSQCLQGSRHHSRCFT